MGQYGPSRGDAALMELTVEFAARRQSNKRTTSDVQIWPYGAGNHHEIVKNWTNGGLFGFGVRTQPPRPERRT